MMNLAILKVAYLRFYFFRGKPSLKSDHQAPLLSWALKSSAEFTSGPVFDRDGTKHV